MSNCHKSDISTAKLSSSTGGTGYRASASEAREGTDCLTELVVKGGVRTLPASIDEIVAESFRVNVEAFKNLDSILQQRCHESSSNLYVEYLVSRADSLKYTTRDIDDITRERNGSETRIKSVLAKISGAENSDLTFSVQFSDRVKISGESDDRAALVLLASDVRSLLREEVKTRSSITWWVRMLITMGGFFLGLLGSQLVGASYSSNFYNQLDAQSTRIQTAQASRLADVGHSIRQTLNSYDSIFASNDELKKQNFLLETDLVELHYDWI